MRLEANIQDLRELAPSVDVDVEALWRSWKSLVQVCAGPRGARNMKISKPAFIARVYRMKLPEARGQALAIRDVAGAKGTDDEVIDLERRGRLIG